MFCCCFCQSCIKKKAPKSSESMGDSSDFQKAMNLAYDAFSEEGYSLTSYDMVSLSQNPNIKGWWRARFKIKPPQKDEDSQVRALKLGRDLLIDVDTTTGKYTILFDD